MSIVGQVHLVLSVVALAAASEATTRLPEAPFWDMVAFSTGVVLLVGAWAVTTRVPRTLRGFRRSRSSATRGCWW